MGADRWRHCCAKERGIFHLPQGTKCSACGEAQKPGIPEAMRAQWAALREEFKQRASAEAVQAERWRLLDVQERRLLLAMCGLDDTEEAARRPWEQMRLADRLTLMTELRGMRRLVGRLQWA